MPGKIGRPTKFTPEVLDKLKEAYLVNATDDQATLQAGISLDALYKYQQRNPDFVKLKNAWKQDLAFKAKKSLQKHIPHDGKLALDVVERLEKDTWSLKPTLELNQTNFTFSFMPNDEFEKLKESNDEIIEAHSEDLSV